MKTSHYLTIMTIALLTAVTPVQAKRLIRYVPENIVQVQGSQQGNAILLSWQGGAGADGYRIYNQQGTELQPGASWIDIDGSRTSYLFEDVSAGASYTFCIAPLNGSQEGITSTPVTVTLDKGLSKRSDLGK